MELPNGWVQTHFEDTVDILDKYRKPVNNTERSNRIAGKTEDELFPYYGATGLVGYIDGYLLDGEYVLLGEDGAPFLSAVDDKAYIARGKIWVNNHAHILRSHCSNAFLCHFLNQFNYKNYITGTTRYKLTQSDMKRIPIPLPPHAEQHRIVAKIDALFSELDKSVEYLNTVKKQLKVYRKAVLKWAFEGKLTGHRAEEWTYKNPRELSAPKEHALTIGPFGSDLKVSDYTETGVPLIFVRDIRSMFRSRAQKFVSAEKAQQLAAHQVCPGDILITKMGDPPGDCCIYPSSRENGIITADCIKWSIDKSQCIAEYIAYAVKSPVVRLQINNITKGVAQKKVSLARFREIGIPVPPLNIQHQIVWEIESRLSVCDKLEQVVDENLARANALRQSILKQAFEGRLVPQDPNDDPAEELLERIKANQQSIQRQAAKRRRKNG